MGRALWVAAAVLVVVGVLAYGLGLLVVLVGETDEACARGIVYEGAEFQRMRSGLLPLEYTCLFEDGTTHAAIPAWVNPLFFAGIIGAVACASTASWLGRSDFVARPRSG